MSFALGQRWISDSESDLGSGTVVAVEGRVINLLFPASGENRIYAKDEAPVTRVAFNVGDTITSHEEWTMLVETIKEEQGLLIYSGSRCDDGSPAALKETHLSHFIKFNKPQDRLFAGQIDRQSRFALRYEALCYQHKRRLNPTRGLAGGRVSLIPHQLYIAHEVGLRYAPRVLLADEVGLGKTIEAGMIIHQQLLSGRAQRVLILLPENLQHQWLVEMLRRFNLHFSLLDEDRIADAADYSDNPFDGQQLVICSLDLLRKKRAFFDLANEANWDLLVVDEAHHLEWQQDKPSHAYQIVETLAEQTPGVLLLTATPDQLGHEGHFARLRLLDPERFYDYPAYLNEEQEYGAIAEAAEALLTQQPLTPAIKALLAEQGAYDLETEQGRHHAVESLLDRHGTGRILFRNSRAYIKGFPNRCLHPHPLPLPAQYQTAIKVMGMMDDRNSTLEQRALRYLYPEKIYQKFEGSGTTWTQFDPRVSWLLELLLAKRQEKVLVICSEAATAIALEEALRTREGIRAGLFHEGMNLIERDRAAAYFAETETGAQVLLCSEIGSEGRNFQFASQLVLFDLPLNPDLLEQRIGRLDRIGQKNDIQIHIPYLDGTAQKSLLQWYHQGINAFEETCPTARPVFEAIHEALFSLLADNINDDEALKPLLAQTQALHKPLKQKLEAGRDRLLEIHSSGGIKAQQLVERLKAEDDDTDMVAFAIKMMDEIGIQQDDRGEHALVLHPTANMLLPSFPGLSDDGMTITFKRDIALSRDDLSFVNWDHPLLRDGMDLILSSDIGSTSVALLKNNALPAGTLFLELIFVAESATHPQLYRFLPPAPIRVLLDKNAQNLAEKVAFAGFNRQLSPVNRQIGSKLVNASQSMIHRLIAKANELAQPEKERLVTEARQTMAKTLGEELQRLQDLKAVNPNVRDSELDYLKNLQTELHHLLDQTQLKLDAIRFVVVAPNS